MFTHLRIARPVTDLERSVAMYTRGLGLQIVGRFKNHDGFDGVMLGHPDLAYHLEFTRCFDHPVIPSPTPEDLLVIYLPDRRDWAAACLRMLEVGFEAATSFNPYWDKRGRTFSDLDGYRVVVELDTWPHTVPHVSLQATPNL